MMLLLKKSTATVLEGQGVYHNFMIYAWPSRSQPYKTNYNNKLHFAKANAHMSQCTVYALPLLQYQSPTT
jgi:hypothetical protein